MALEISAARAMGFNKAILRYKKKILDNQIYRVFEEADAHIYCREHPDGGRHRPTTRPKAKRGIRPVGNAQWVDRRTFSSFSSVP